MSWDEISKREKPCPCGQGKVVVILEADDWNRTRTGTEICCPVCHKEQKEAESKIAAYEHNARGLRTKAQELARRRFLHKFQQLFAGHTKSDVWKQLHGGSGYPALGTFYAHIRHVGSVQAYLQRHFLAKLEDLFPALFRDKEIESLLRQARNEAQKATGVRRVYAKYLPQDG